MGGFAPGKSILNRIPHEVVDTQLEWIAGTEHFPRDHVPCQYALSFHQLQVHAVIFHGRAFRGGRFLRHFGISHYDAIIEGRRKIRQDFHQEVLSQKSLENSAGLLRAPFGLRHSAMGVRHTDQPDFLVHRAYLYHRILFQWMGDRSFLVAFHGGNILSGVAVHFFHFTTGPDYFFIFGGPLFPHFEIGAGTFSVGRNGVPRRRRHYVGLYFCPVAGGNTQNPESRAQPMPSAHFPALLDDLPAESRRSYPHGQPRVQDFPFIPGNHRRRGRGYLHRAHHFDFHPMHP